MHPLAAWTVTSEVELDAERSAQLLGCSSDAALTALANAAAACNNAHLESDGQSTGDPTEVALLTTARTLGVDVAAASRARRRSHQYNFDPERKLMSTLDTGEGHDWLHTKGAPESVLPRCISVLSADGEQRPLEQADRDRVTRQVESFANQGLRVLALARRSLPSGTQPPDRDVAERDLCFLGLITMHDPPRAEVRDAVARCHSAGIRIVIITGDHPLTAAAIARQVGIGGEDPVVVTAQTFDYLHEQEVKDILASGREVIFARASPETKLQIAEALRSQGHVVAMTGDGVNDAPALRRADIGVAMGRSGTDVAREASTMVITDDNFATIVVAIEAGRQVYDNVRKFIQYIFAHATPEVVPFLVFAFAGGAIPLPLTVLQILAFDVGIETLPSLALGREPIEPGSMDRPPRPRSEGVIQAPMLVRAWVFLGVMVAGLSLAGFFYVLTRAGWHLGDSVGVGHRLHHAYLQATTMTFLGILAGQIGTAFAVRARRASLRSIGVFSNRYLIAGIAAELLLAAIFIYTPPLQSLLGTAGLPLHDLALLLPYPFIVWGADELRRWLLRRHETRLARRAS
jgi:magnesium-transporting ATPase (P-type)